MNWLNSFFIAISTYSILPTPATKWDSKDLANALGFLPVVGVFIAASLILWQSLSMFLGIGSLMFAAMATILPWLITGGIHMDGFMDTADAIFSRQSRESKLEIMQDPHSGAFAVMSCSLYFLLTFALYETLYAQSVWWIVAIIYILSRLLCVLSTTILPKARKEGMLHTFTAAAANYSLLTIMLLLSLAGAVFLLGLNLKIGLVMIFTILIVIFSYSRLTSRHFGGITGDTSGFFIQFTELSLLVAVWIGGLL